MACSHLVSMDEMVAEVSSEGLAQVRSSKGHSMQRSQNQSPGMGWGGWEGTMYFGKTEVRLTTAKCSWGAEGVLLL